MDYLMWDRSEKGVNLPEGHHLEGLGLTFERSTDGETGESSAFYRSPTAHCRTGSPN